MLQPLLFIISYGALLLLLMPANAVGILTTVAVFTLGLGVILYKKIYKIQFWKCKQYLLIPTSTLIVAFGGAFFYNQWIHSSILQRLAAMVHISVETMVLIGSLILAVSSVYFVCACLQMILHVLSRITHRYIFEANILFCIIASIIITALPQIMLNVEAVSMGHLNFTMGVLIVAVFILFLYCILGRMTPSFIMGAGIFMVISTINVYVYSFRERLFEPVDLFSAGTAMNVLENYSLFPIPDAVVRSWGFFLIMVMLLHCMQPKEKPATAVKKRLVTLAACAISTVAIFFYASGLKTYHWAMEGAQFNGYVLDFAAKIKEITVSKPDNYSTALIGQIADQYTSDTGTPEINSEEPPHLIVIMDEAFSDLRVAGSFSTNTEVMPFISSLKANTVSGYALASVYGGNTANSEFEFLTGNSMAWLSPNTVPYQQYIRSSSCSMASYLKTSFNYKCIAMHPFLSSGWNRPLAYKHLGFDESYFVEDFPQEHFVRSYISDQESFSFLIETYEAQKENPLFIFSVTMQNHGGYTYTGDNYTKHISLTGLEGAYPEVEQYLSLIYETDKAVEQLINYFQAVDEDVVIVFFGDHQPKVDQSFYEEISGAEASTLDQRQKQYMVPFFIWANYDIEEQQLDCTSLNYLSSYVYDVAGIALPPYSEFLREMEAVIPAINANGYCSLANGCYIPFDEATGEERSWLELYEALQYNNLFDTKNRNEEMFPVLE